MKAATNANPRRLRFILLFVRFTPAAHVIATTLADQALWMLSYIYILCYYATASHKISPHGRPLFSDGTVRYSVLCSCCFDSVTGRWRLPCRVGNYTGFSAWLNWELHPMLLSTITGQFSACIFSQVHDRCMSFSCTFIDEWCTEPKMELVVQDLPFGAFTHKKDLFCQFAYSRYFSGTFM